MLTGVDYVVKALIDLGVGEVGGEYGENVAGIGDGIGNGFVCVSCVPFVCAKVTRGGNGTIQSFEAGFACGEGLVVKGDFVVMLIV